MLTAAGFAFAFFEEGSQTGQPFLPATGQIVGRQGICQLLKLLRMTAFEERIGTLLKIDPFGAHAVGQPVVLIEANARRKRQVGTDAHEHPTPVLVVNVKVILHDPTRCQLEVPALFLPDGDHDPGRFPGFENDNHLIVLGVPKVGSDKVITPLLGRIQKGHAPSLATVYDPVVKLLGNIAQKIAANPLALPIGIKEADDSLRLLKRLNQSVQKNAIKTTVGKFDVILMMFAEGVHCLLQVVRYQEHIG